MREILFRGKRLYVDEWVYGTLIICQGKYYIATDTTKITASYTAISGDGTSDGLHYNICGLCEVNPETVGQYTGLTDKNGKKIFEGDILHFKAYQGGGFACPVGTDIYYKILFGECNPEMDTVTDYMGFWALSVKFANDDLYQYGSSIRYILGNGACVIGNIHDNHEILDEIIGNTPDNPELLAEVRE